MILSGPLGRTILKLMELSSINFRFPGSIRDVPYWTPRKNNFETDRAVQYQYN